MKYFFGDLHCHCNTGLAKGSIERLYQLAENHLDFLCFTPHSQFPDLLDQGMPEDIIRDHYQMGFDKTREGWPHCQKLCKDYYRPGKFVTFLGFEWHSAFAGDIHVVLPKDSAPLPICGLPELKQFARDHGGILVPHHPAYLAFHRGSDPALWDPALMPLLEIFSEHGNAESDRAPYPYYTHSMGGRTTALTYRSFLAQGKRIGAAASTDDHLGYPGAYGEGQTMVLAKELTRESLLDAFRRRRTCAVSGDRITLDFRINGKLLGSDLPDTKKRKITVKARGWDALNRVELLRNGRVIYRKCPEELIKPDYSKPVIVRIEYGWGVFSGGLVFDWDLDIGVDKGELQEVMPAFQSGPYEEDRRDLITNRTPSGCSLVSYTSRKQAFQTIPTKAVALKIKGKPGTQISLKLRKPSKETQTLALSDLEKENRVFLTGNYPAPSLMVHRPVFAPEYETSFELTDRKGIRSGDCYYVRVFQENGHLLTSSPIWVGKKP